MKIAMSEQEIATLVQFLELTYNYFEFGSGGSTVLASKTVSGEIYSAESDANWAKKVADATSDNERVHVKHVDIGPTGDWGAPKSMEHSALFPNYSASILDCGSIDFDFCLIDGRFRVASFLQAVRTARTDTVIAFHDYTSRPHYHEVERFARPIAKCQDLMVFVKRPGIHPIDIEAALQKYQLIWY